jgi:hypothetical protein
VVVARILKVLKTRTRAKAAVRPIFRAMDEDREGGISHAEFIQAMRRWGLRESTEQLNWVAEAIDSDGEGRIKYDAFARAMVSSEMEDGLLKPELKAALAVVRGEAAPHKHHQEFTHTQQPNFPQVRTPRQTPSTLRAQSVFLVACTKYTRAAQPRCASTLRAILAFSIRPQTIV